jgi:hypothetical protein
MFHARRWRMSRSRSAGKTWPSESMGDTIDASMRFLYIWTQISYYRIHRTSRQFTPGDSRARKRCRDEHRPAYNLSGTRAEKPAGGLGLSPDGPSRDPPPDGSGRRGRGGDALALRGAVRTGGTDHSPIDLIRNGPLREGPSRAVRARLLQHRPGALPGTDQAGQENALDPGDRQSQRRRRGGLDPSCQAPRGGRGRCRGAQCLLRADGS